MVIIQILLQIIMKKQRINNIKNIKYNFLNQDIKESKLIEPTKNVTTINGAIIPFHNNNRNILASNNQYQPSQKILETKKQKNITSNKEKPNFKIEAPKFLLFQKSYFYEREKSKLIELITSEKSFIPIEKLYNNDHMAKMIGKGYIVQTQQLDNHNMKSQNQFIKSKMQEEESESQISIRIPQQSQQQQQNKIFPSKDQDNFCFNGLDAYNLSLEKYFQREETQNNKYKNIFQSIQDKSPHYKNKKNPSKNYFKSNHKQNDGFQQNYNKIGRENEQNYLFYQQIKKKMDEKYHNLNFQFF